MDRLKGKRVLVTGGATGIGRASVEEFARRGCVVGIHYYSSADAAAEARDAINDDGGQAETFQADLTDEARGSAMVRDFAAWAGGVDILVNNAGDLVARRRIEEIDVAFLNDVQRLNVDSMLAVTRAALPWLKEAGQSSVVNVASVAARNGGGPGSLAYATAKGAMITWTRGLSRELAEFGIRVNAVAPGLTLGTRFHPTHTSPEVVQRVIKGIPLGRAGQPEDIARAIVFLAGEYDGFITGVALDVNGGVCFS